MIKSITSGSHTNFILTSNSLQNIFCFGRNTYGECCINPNVDNIIKIPTLIDELTCYSIKQISSADFHTLILTNDGKIFSFGFGKYGRLGNGNEKNSYKPILIHTSEEVIYINCGGASSLYITKGYDLYCWGYNNYGQIGLGNNNVVFYSLPMKVSGNGINELKIMKAVMGEEHCIGISNTGNIVYIYITIYLSLL